MPDYLTLIIGVLCAGLGGELFVRGAVGLARWARVAPSLVGVTVAAFATSSPELSVAVNSALAGEPQISLGNVLGSNVVNVAVILGITLLFGSLRGARDDVKRDYPVALLVPLILGLLSLDHVLSRGDGVILLSVFLVWFVVVAVQASRQRSTTEQVPGERRPWLAVPVSLFGLVFLFAAGHFITDGARGIAAGVGLGEFIIGAVIVALGTTVPEMMTALVSRLRGHEEVGLGTVLGSVIFNGLFITAVAAIIHPIEIPWDSLTTALAFGVATVAVAIPSGGTIPRWRGVVLLLLYALYLLTIIHYQ